MKRKSIQSHARIAARFLNHEGLSGWGYFRQHVSKVEGSHESLLGWVRKQDVVHK